MAKKVALINMKGGVGKSTLAVNLAWQFAAYLMWRKRVLVIDLDPQFNASQYLIGATSYEDILRNNEPTIWDVFEQFTRTPGRESGSPLDPNATIHNVVSYSEGGRIDLIPSRLELAYSLRHPLEKEELLAKLVRKVEDRYDLILLDCAPTESLLTMAAYLTSDYLLVPVKPEYLSSIGLPLLRRSLIEFSQRHDGHELSLAGVVFNHTSDYAPEEHLSKEEVKDTATRYDWYVFNNEVPYSRSFPKGARYGRPIFWTSHARRSQKESFHDFAVEFAQRIRL